MLLIQTLLIYIYLIKIPHAERVKVFKLNMAAVAADMEFGRNFTLTRISGKSSTLKYIVNYDFFLT